MEYFFEYGIRFPYDDHAVIQIEKEGSSDDWGHFAFKIRRYINDNRYTYYYYPIDGRNTLICLFFSLDLHHFNKGYHRYPENFKYAQKAWPKLTDAFLRGKKSNYEEPAIQTLRDFGSKDEFSEKWMLCKLIDFESPKSILLTSHFEEVCTLIRYANDMLEEFLNKDISSFDKFRISIGSLFTNVTTGISDGISQTVGRAVHTVSIKNNQTLANYARLCAHVYGTYTDSILPSGCLIIDKYFDSSTGLRVAFYRMQYEYVCAFAGTKTGQDWVENGLQVLGASDQYEAALNYVKKLMNEYSLSNIKLVGHSQGGGEAAYCAWALGGNSVTFNPAGVSLKTLNKGGTKVSSVSTIDSYVFANDILNIAQEIATQMIPVLGLCADGHVHYINDANPQSISLDEFHGMSGILRYFGIRN